VPHQRLGDGAEEDSLEHAFAVAADDDERRLELLDPVEETRRSRSTRAGPRKSTTMGRRNALGDGANQRNNVRDQELGVETMREADGVLEREHRAAAEIGCDEDRRAGGNAAGRGPNRAFPASRATVPGVRGHRRRR
jgi:hypothetical protein